ncbi:MAG: c-type cytochrome biogenesis protein CcmI, partial [Hyphomicrobiales bacterium]|nr:c-type cytochrome biogenesis protein CcmI [Hyphomicrobiales bacterium]
MLLGVLLVILAVLAAVIVAAPFLRQKVGSADVEKGVHVYKDQLSEVERDLEQGSIGKEEADLARVEIQRRILNAAKTDGSEAVSLGGHWHYRIVTGVAAVVIL